MTPFEICKSCGKVCLKLNKIELCADCELGEISKKNSNQILVSYQENPVSKKSRTRSKGSGVLSDNQKDLSRFF